jgi:HEAT repeat protein
MHRFNALPAVALILALAVIAAVFPADASAQSPVRAERAIGIMTDPTRSPQDRINAANDLAVSGRDSDAATQALIGIMSNDPVPAVRAAAARALGASAFPSAAPIQAVIQTLNSDSSAQVRLAAVQALDILGVDSASAVAALRNAASNDASPEVRQAAQGVYNRLTSNS